MKKIFTYILSLLISQILFAQENGALNSEQGIHFESASNWKEVTDKAKKENKYIFVDCYATWCVPCKYMSQTIFPLPEVGDYFNDRFVNVKIQMDRTKTDPDEVKQWYKDAKELNEKYAIGAYPTYLVFSPDGKALHRVIGTTKTGNDFIAKIEESFKPDRQYYTNILEYKKHKGDSAFLRNAIKVAFDASDQNNASAIANYYYQSVKDPFAKDNLQTFFRTTKSSKDKAYPMFLKQSAKVNAIMGVHASENLVSQVMIAEDIKPLFDKKDAPAPDWEKLFKKMKTKYPIVSDKTIEELKPIYYRIKNNVPEFEKSIVVYMNKYNEQLSAFEKNEYAWNVFERSSDKEVLQQASAWSKRAVELTERFAFNYDNYVDTYANLLYKLGNKDEALKWEREAIEASQKNNNEKKVLMFKETIAKMERGEKTW